MAKIIAVGKGLSKYNVVISKNALTQKNLMVGLKAKNKICFIKNPKFQFYKNFMHLPSSLDIKLLNKYKRDQKILKFSFQYSITNYRFKINVFEILSKEFDDIPDIEWIKKTEISKIPIPTLFKKILN